MDLRLRNHIIALVIVTLVISTASLLACSKERNGNSDVKVLPSEYGLRSEAEAVARFMEIYGLDEPSPQGYVMEPNDIEARLYTYGEFNNLFKQEYGATSYYRYPDNLMWLVSIDGIPPIFNNRPSRGTYFFAMLDAETGKSQGYGYLPRPLPR